MTNIPHFNIPLDLPHAGRVSCKIRTLLFQRITTETAELKPLIDDLNSLVKLLRFCRLNGQNPEDPNEMTNLKNDAAEVGRRIVNHVEVNDLKSDRVGHAIRNLFECLELGQEGARLSLVAGENPNSLQRSV